MTLSIATTTIDVRTIAPRERHATIFAAFRNLGIGGALEIVNDHDPQPLRYQFEIEAPGSFSWTYVENGPDTWRVAIGKTARSHSAGNCCGGCGGSAA